MHAMPYETNHAKCYFGEEHSIAFVTYSGAIGGDVTTHVYDWVAQVFETYGVKAVRGSVFDFRDVTEFLNTNLRAVQKRSTGLNLQVDMTHIAVGLIVKKNLAQENMVRTALKLSPQETRKRVVYSMDEALAFVNEYRKAFDGVPLPTEPEG